MTKEELQQLNRGDIVRHKSGGEVYVVDANYGDRVTAVTTVDITNPIEWEVVAKARYESSNQQ